jgi:hypothetical protein
MKGRYKKFSVIGGGGINCKCCCGLGYKPIAKRIAKRRLNRAVKQIVKEVLNASD